MHLKRYTAALAVFMLALAGLFAGPASAFETTAESEAAEAAEAAAAEGWPHGVSTTPMENYWTNQAYTNGKSCTQPGGVTYRVCTKQMTTWTNARGWNPAQPNIHRVIGVKYHDYNNSNAVRIIDACWSGYQYDGGVNGKSGGNLPQHVYVNLRGASTGGRWLYQNNDPSIFHRNLWGGEDKPGEVHTSYGCAGDWPTNYYAEGGAIRVEFAPWHREAYRVYMRLS